MQNIVRRYPGLLGIGEREAGIIATEKNNTVTETGTNHWQQQRDITNVLKQRDGATQL